MLPFVMRQLLLTILLWLAEIWYSKWAPETIPVALLSMGGNIISRHRNKSTFVDFIHITSQRQTRIWTQGSQTPKWMPLIITVDSEYIQIFFLASAPLLALLLRAYQSQRTLRGRKYLRDNGKGKESLPLTCLDSVYDSCWLSHEFWHLWLEVVVHRNFM